MMHSEKSPSPPHNAHIHLDGLPRVAHEPTALKVLVGKRSYGTGNEMITPPITS